MRIEDIKPGMRLRVAIPGTHRFLNTNDEVQVDRVDRLYVFLAGAEDLAFFPDRFEPLASEEEDVSNNPHESVARAIKAAKIASYFGERGISGPRVKYLSDATIREAARCVGVRVPSDTTIALVRELLTEGVDAE